MKRFTSPLTKVRDFLVPQGFPSYLVGGYVRDTLLGQVSRDIDIAIEANALEVAQKVANILGGKYVLLDEANKVARVVFTESGNRWYFDFSTIEGDIEVNLACRDFTIDAIAVDLREWREDNLNLIDPFNGREDLDAGVIKVVKGSAFEDDPARLLRAVRLAAEYGFTIEEGTEKLIRSQSHLIQIVAGERVREDLCRLLSTPNSAHYLYYLDQLNLLTTIIPELARAKGVEQPKEHFWDVFCHSIETVAAVERLLYPEKSDKVVNLVPFLNLSQYFGEEIGSGINRKILLKLAALFHDIAKPQTKREENGRARFFGHTAEGAKIAGAILQRLRFGTREIKMVQKMIENHLRLFQMSNEALPTRRAIYRYFRDTGDVAIDTIFLTLADYLATRGENLDLAEWERHIKMVEYILSERDREKSIVAPPKLIDGHDLINLFSMKPGPEIGRILEMVREAQGAGEIKNREEAIAFVRRQLAIKGKE